jgi:hypothetical protein
MCDVTWPGSSGEELRPDVLHKSYIRSFPLSRRDGASRPLLDTISTISLLARSLPHGVLVPLITPFACPLKQDPSAKLAPMHSCTRCGPCAGADRVHFHVELLLEGIGTAMIDKQCAESATAGLGKGLYRPASSVYLVDGAPRVPT